MAKNTSEFFCTSCASIHPKWHGKCPQCGEWNTIEEREKEKRNAPNTLPKQLASQRKGLRLLSEVELHEEPRISSPIKEWNRVLGGGIVPGSVILLGGEPGVGKSTLLLQLAMGNYNSRPILYASGEESASQIALRSQRLPLENNACHLLTTTQILEVLKAAKQLMPAFIVLDSIQTMHSDNSDSYPGSITQIRECSQLCIQFAKAHHIPIILVGHLNKEGSLAGPKVLEHMVDVVLQMEGEQNNKYRMLRSHKNRFGSTHEMGIFEMTTKGMQEVLNPNTLLSGSFQKPLSGIAVSSVQEGLRSFLIETQSLVSKAVYGTPQRSCTGYDAKRLNMLLAVLEKKCGFQLGDKDVFLNITGGLKIHDTNLDMGVLMAILSSLLDHSIPPSIAFCGEVGLSGEIRPAKHLETHAMNAMRSGIKVLYCSSFGELPSSKKMTPLQLVPIPNVMLLYNTVFKNAE